MGTVTTSDLLFANPRIWYGAARLLDLGAVFDSYNEFLTPEQADALALYSDWYMAGKDLQAAFEQLVREHSKPHHVAR